MTVADELTTLRIDFCVGGNSQEFTQSGWHEPETDGTWTQGIEAHVRVPIGGRTGPLHCILQVVPILIDDARPHQKLVILVDGVEVFRGYATSNGTFQFDVPAALIDSRDTVAFTLISSRISDSDVIQQDPGPLGYFVTSLTLSTEEISAPIFVSELTSTAILNPAGTVDTGIWADERTAPIARPDHNAKTSERTLDSNMNNSLFPRTISTEGEPINATAVTGWSRPELIGVWNDGAEASFNLHGLLPGIEYECLMEVHPHIAPPQLLQQRIRVNIRGQIVYNATLMGPTTVKFPVPTDTANPHENISISLFLPDAISPRSLGTGADERALGILVSSVTIAQTAGTISTTIKSPDDIEVTFLQTADAIFYKEMLDLTSAVNIQYCQRHGFHYESFTGIKKGAAAWMATYNRIFMLHELMARGYRGWVAYLDADAYVADFEFDLKRYLRDNSGYCFLISTGGGSDTPWDVNAGIFFLNLGDIDGRALVDDWLTRFQAMVPEHFLASPTSKWDDYPNDQAILYECLKFGDVLLQKTKIEKNRLYNYLHGQFIKQAIRAGFPDLHGRTQWIRAATSKLLASISGNSNYVDLTGLANQYGSDKGDTIGNAHYYTQFYQFLFEEFRTAEFEFVEIGLLRGGPEIVGSSADREVGDLPSVRMWLEYFPKAICHGVDVSDFSNFKLDRFRFHKCDLNSAEDVAKLRAGLPKVRFILDDASHASYHQQVAFVSLFRLVQPGGYYIIEDLDWQPETYEPYLPKCRLTRDIFLEFTYTRDLEIGIVNDAERKSLAGMIGRVHVQRRRGDGMIKMIALERL